MDPTMMIDKKGAVEGTSEEEDRAPQARHPEDADFNCGSKTGDDGKTERGMMASSVADLARHYLAGRPGRRNNPSNTALYSDIELFKAGYFSGDHEAIEKIRSQLLYRTWCAKSANSYHEVMNLNNVPAIEEWDQENPGPATALAKENFAVIRSSGLFRRPDASLGYWGQVWQKPFHYLAYAFAASGYGPDDISRHMELLNQTHSELALDKMVQGGKLATAQDNVHRDL